MPVYKFNIICLKTVRHLVSEKQPFFVRHFVRHFQTLAHFFEQKQYIGCLTKCLTTVCLVKNVCCLSGGCVLRTPPTRHLSVRRF